MNHPRISVHPGLMKKEGSGINYFLTKSLEWGEFTRSYTDLGGSDVSPLKLYRTAKSPTRVGLGMGSALHLLGFTVSLVPAPNRGALLLLPQ